MHWVLSRAAELEEQMKAKEAEVERVQSQVESQQTRYEEAVKARQEQERVKQEANNYCNSKQPSNLPLGTSKSWVIARSR